MSSDLADLSAVRLVQLVERGEVSPVEVIQAALVRVERFNGLVNALCTLSPRALEEARQAEERLRRGAPARLLEGLPVGIKDVTETAGLRTTYGSPLYRDFVPGEDALVVQRLKAAGAIVVGKTNAPEFAAGGNTFNTLFGATRNPWDPRLSAGGSTGGGAAALATGMIALAEGTDLGGSLRIPASFCGVVGLRPSPGLVPTSPSPYVWDTLQVTGPLARNVEDVALMLQAVAGPSPLSPLAQPVQGRDFRRAVGEASGTGRLFAYCADISGIGVEREVEECCRSAALALEETGARVEQIELDLSWAWEAFLALRGLWMLVFQYRHLDRLPELGENVRGNVEAGLAVSSRELAAAEQVRSRLWRRLGDLLGRYQALLTPCMAIPPFPVEQNFPTHIGSREMKTYVDWIAPTFLLSLSGLPVASVPCGLDGRGLPVGLQVLGPVRGEETVLSVSQLLFQLRSPGRPPLLEDSTL